MSEAQPAEGLPEAAPAAERRPDEVAVADVELHLPARAESVSIARQAVCGVGDALLMDEARLADVALAVTEACTNVVMHAYPEGAGDYELRVWIQHHRVLIAVRDYGGGVTPRMPGSKAGLGLGLPLMLAVCDEVTFARGADGSMEVRLAFRLDEGGDGG
jgi:anti-sigma regulatory factor (Ser/Thr protein kinase)